MAKESVRDATFVQEVKAVVKDKSFRAISREQGVTDRALRLAIHEEILTLDSNLTP